MDPQSFARLLPVRLENPPLPLCPLRFQLFELRHRRPPAPYPPPTRRRRRLLPEHPARLPTHEVGHQPRPQGWPLPTLPLPPLRCPEALRHPATASTGHHGNRSSRRPPRLAPRLARPSQRITYPRGTPPQRLPRRRARFEGAAPRSFRSRQERHANATSITQAPRRPCPAAARSPAHPGAGSPPGVGHGNQDQAGPAPSKRFDPQLVPAR